MTGRTDDSIGVKNRGAAWLLLVVVFVIVISVIVALRSGTTEQLAPDEPLQTDLKTDSPTDNPTDLNDLVITQNVVIDESEDSYRKEGDGYYHLSSKRAIFSKTMLMQRQATSKPKPFEVRNKPDTKLPNRSSGEYRRCQLIRADDGRILFVENFRVNILAGVLEDGLFVELKTETEVSFMKGDWTQFTEGEEVIVRYTDAGLQKLKSSMEAHTERSIVASFQAGWTEGPSTSKPPKASCKAAYVRFPNRTIVINKETIKSTADGPSELTATTHTTTKTM